MGITFESLMNMRQYSKTIHKLLSKHSVFHFSQGCYIVHIGMVRLRSLFGFLGSRVLFNSVHLCIISKQVINTFHSK